MSEKCPIIAIDPGNRQSAYCVIDCNTLRPLEFGIIMLQNPKQSRAVQII